MDSIAVIPLEPALVFERTGPPSLTVSHAVSLSNQALCLCRRRCNTPSPRMQDSNDEESPGHHTLWLAADWPYKVCTWRKAR